MRNSMARSGGLCLCQCRRGLSRRPECRAEQRDRRRGGFQLPDLYDADAGGAGRTDLVYFGYDKNLEGNTFGQGWVFQPAAILRDPVPDQFSGASLAGPGVQHRRFRRLPDVPYQDFADLPRPIRLSRTHSSKPAYRVPILATASPAWLAARNADVDYRLTPNFHIGAKRRVRPVRRLHRGHRPGLRPLRLQRSAVMEQSSMTSKSRRSAAGPAPCSGAHSCVRFADEVDSLAAAGERDDMLRGIGKRMAHMTPLPQRSVPRCARNGDERRVWRGSAGGSVRLRLHEGERTLFVTHSGLRESDRSATRRGQWLSALLEGLYEAWFAQQPGHRRPLSHAGYRAAAWTP